MTAATYGLEEGSPKRGWLSQIAITLFLGIPMTFAMAVALVFYCSYECLKFALSTKSPGGQTPSADDQAFTSTLAQFAAIHQPSQPVEAAGLNPAPGAPAQNQNAEKSGSLHSDR